MIVDNPEHFLHDSGLLFHINRSILHPLGYSLSVMVEDSEDIETVLFMLHETDDPKGFIIDQKEIQAMAAKYNTFISQRKERALYRGKSLGYIMQPFEDNE